LRVWESPDVSQTAWSDRFHVHDGAGGNAAIVCPGS
jgi:hypothetical protein